MTMERARRKPAYRILRGKEIVENARNCFERGRSIWSPHFDQRLGERKITLVDVRDLLFSAGARADITRPIPKQFHGYVAYNYELQGAVRSRRLIAWFHFVVINGNPVIIWGSAAWKDD